MKEIEVIDKVIDKLEREYGYSAKDIVRDNHKYLCDLIVNYPGTNKPFIVVEAKSPDSNKMHLDNAKEQVTHLLQTTDLEPVFLMLTNYHSSLCFLVDKTGTTLLRPVEDIPFRYGTGLIIKQTYREDDIYSALNMAYESLWTDGSMQQLKAFDEINKLLLCVLYFELIEYKGNKITPLLNYLWANDGGVDELKSTLRNKINMVFDNAKESFPRIFNDDIALDKNKLLYVMVLLQEIHISDERSRDIIRKGYEMFTTRVLGEGKVNKNVLNFIVKSVSVNNRETLLLPYGRGTLHSLLVEENGKNMTEICGVDINQRHVQTSKIKRILTGGTPDGVEVGEGISNRYSDVNSAIIQKRLYDTIISIPPTDRQIKMESVESDEYELFQKGIGFDAMDTTKAGLRIKQNIEVLFLEKCYQNLRDNGTLAIVLPDALLANKNMQYVRDWMITHFKVIAIVSLPKDAIKTKQRTTKSSFLLLRKFSNHIVERHKDLLYDLRQQLSASKMSKEEYVSNMLKEYSLRVTDIVPEYSLMLFDVKEGKEKEYEEVSEKLRTIKDEM